MEIMYWSDIACPFCYIGSNRMKKAMKEVGIYDDTKLEFKSFQLDPNAPKQTDEKFIVHMSGGDKSKEEQAQMQMNYIGQMAKQDGLAFDIDNAKFTNTMDAHRLIKLAETKGNRDLVENVITRFYKVFFGDADNIADHDVLVNAAVEAGLNKLEVEEVLNSNKYEDVVRKDELDAYQSGVTAAPFFVINNKYGISGAQPYEVFVNALKQVLNEESKA